jgi:uncharacterized membrane protein YfhO
MRSVISYFKKHPVILLMAVIFITALIAYHNYIFGGYLFLFDDMGSDTKQLYIMHYNSIVNHLRDGDLSLWDASNGFGTSIYQYTLFNPLLCVIYLFGLIFGNAVMAKMLVWIVIAAMILSGIAMWHFLSCFTFSKRAKFIAAYLYSFNGFLTLWGQHFAFLAITVYMPFVLMLIEKAIRRKRFSPAAAICTGLMVLCTYYFSYMFIIILALYVILRIWTLRPAGAREYFSTLFKQAAAVMLGVGIGMLNLLPNVGIVFGVSSRTESTASIIERIASAMQPWPKEYYKTLADRFLSSGLQGNTSYQAYTGYSNYYETPSVFFTSLFIILLVQFIIYLIIKKWDRRYKAASVIALACGAFMLLIPAGSLPFNFFAYPFSRHTFLLMPFFALLTAFMLQKLFAERFLSVIGLAVSTAGCLYVYYVAYKQALVLTVVLLALGLALLTLVLAAVLVLYAKGPKKLSGLCFVLIFLSVFGQAGLDLFSTVRGREIAHSSDYFVELYGGEYDELSEWLEENDTEEYRLERDFYTASYCMDNLALGYSGVSSYNSTMNSNILDFINELLPDMIYIDNSHISFRQIGEKTQLHDLFGIKYIVSKSDTPPYEGYELVKQLNEIYLYKNTNWDGFSSFYTKTCSESEYEKLKDSGVNIDTAALMSQVLILEDDEVKGAGVTADELTKYEETVTDEYFIDKENIPTSTDGRLNYVWFGDDGSYNWGGTSPIYLPLNKEIASGGETISVSFNINFVSGNNVYISTEEGGNEYIAAIPIGNTGTVNLTLPAGTKGIYLRIQHGDTTVSVSDFEFYASDKASHTQNAEVYAKETGSDGEYHIEVNNDEAGYLLTPIPYEDGWSVKVDGEEAKAVTADYGFFAVWLEAGEHVVEYSYEQPYLKEGAILSAVSAMACAAIIIFQRRKKQYEMT